MAKSETEMRPSTSKIDSRLNPYEDWEKATRLSSLKKKPKHGSIGPWHPVFVSLDADKGEYPYRAAALSVLNRVIRPASESGGNVLALDIIGFVFLLRAFSSHKDLEHPDQFARLFLWRPSKHAYNSDNGVFSVEFVGAESSTLEVTNFEDSENDIQEEEIEGLIQEIRGNASSFPADQIVTAIIDDQIGYAHERLRSAVDKSRVDMAFIHRNESFNLNGGSIKKPGIAFVDIGGLLLRKSIDTQLHELDEIDLYRQVDREVEKDFGFLPFGLEKLLTNFTTLREFRASHGTFVADIASGKPIEDAVNNRPVVAFDLSRLTTGDTSGTRLDVFALIGLQFVVGVVPLISNTERTTVVNLSYGLQSGPKDGSGFFEREAEKLINAQNENQLGATFLVLPSGNSYRTHGRARLVSNDADAMEVEWHIQPGDRTPSYAEFWTEPDEEAVVNLTTPFGCVHEIPLKAETKVNDIVWNGQNIARTYAIYNGDKLRVTIAVAPTSIPDEPTRFAPAGKWLISLRAGSEPVGFDVNIQRDDTPSGYRVAGRQSYFDSPNVGHYDPETGWYNAPEPEDSPVGRLRTVSAYATGGGEHTFVVGGAFDTDQLSEAALYSASGPSNNSTMPVDLAAVTEESRAHPGRLAAGMMSSSSAVFSGTSTAAPLVTRRLVDELSKDASLSKKELIEKLLDGPRRSDARLGAGATSLEHNKAVKPRRFREEAS